MLSTETEIIYEAKFSPRLKTHWFLYVLYALAISVVGLILAPFWLLGVGYWWCNRYFRTLKCVITAKNLELRKGGLIRIEKTIPLDRIQDITLKEGPLLRALKLASVRVETAGQSGTEGVGDASVVGIMEPLDFRSHLLAQRERVVSSRNDLKKITWHASADDTVQSLLTQILEVLTRIEKRLDRGPSA